MSGFISAHPSAAFDHAAGAVAAVPTRSAGAAVAASSSKSHKCDSEASGIKFFTLDRERQKRLRHATQPAKLAALHEEKKARRWCIAHGYCVAYFTHDRKFFTWHLYPSQAAVLAHVDYLNFVFRAHGGCPPVAKLRIQGRLWSAAEKLTFERGAYGI